MAKIYLYQVWVEKEYADAVISLLNEQKGVIETEFMEGLMAIRQEARHTSAEDRVRNLEDAARRLSKVRAGHTRSRSSGCEFCKAYERIYELALMAYTDPFGTRADRL
jgi:hypothetical protein